MILHIKRLVYDALKDDLFRLHVLERDKYNNYEGRGRHKVNDGCDLDLSSMTRKEAENLLKLLEKTQLHGTRILAADIKKFFRASDEGIESIRARTVRQGAWMLEHYFSELPNHIVFSEDEYGGKSHSGYYVEDVEYKPERRSHNGYIETPEHTTIVLYHIEDDVRHRTSVDLFAADIYEMTCVEILDKQGFVPESQNLMEKLAKETDRYYEQRELIGKQCVAVGCGLKDLDDATDDNSKYRWGTRKIHLDLFGTSAKVVIDVIKETEKDDERRSGRGSSPNPYRWHNWNSRYHAPNEDELVKHLEADEDSAEPVDFDIPIHPLVPCFDLKRHVRLRIHVNNLTPYKYSQDVASRLVLPERDWRMVNLLVDHSSNTFQDIVSNKGQSMNVLAVGPPGTGKTATAEIFAEFKERPLYTVQCSQLGMTPDEVESNLGVVMMRANRWNAVLLLDEADVYIRKRGTDLNQNAIVGAFLRVLEYASCILFMTTNLGDEVDDAISSRCIAKLQYDVPSPKDQARIWRILADLNKLELTDAEINKVVTKHPRISGRDVKNLLKLASFVVQANGKPLDAAAIEYAIQFKPTE